MFSENEAIYKNASIPELTFKKKKVSILYHKCRETVDAVLALIYKEGAAFNLADMFTKMMVQIRRKTLLDKLM